MPSPSFVWPFYSSAMVHCKKKNVDISTKQRHEKRTNFIIKYSGFLFVLLLFSSLFTSRTSVTVFVCKRTNVPFLETLSVAVHFWTNCWSHGYSGMGAISSGFCSRGLVSLGLVCFLFRWSVFYSRSLALSLFFFLINFSTILF